MNKVKIKKKLDKVEFLLISLKGRISPTTTPSEPLINLDYISFYLPDI